MTELTAATARRSPLHVRRILIANRGEIAVRIVRACRDLGLEAIVAYSEADRRSKAVGLADDAICIGPPLAARSYLDQATILAAAKGLRADAIHPGYGFLAENADFAAACADEGILFIGPPARAIETMGNKMGARRLAETLDVPVLPGSVEAVGVGHARIAAEELGYPVLVKAAAGGGGRGMRRVDGPAALEEVVAGASAEAAAAFGDSSLYLERYLPNARHVEIQVAADAHGSTVHLGERDCTIQRRYQKLVEEAPSPVLDNESRFVMVESAIRLCREVRYEGVGTVEYLYDQDAHRPYFIEMNTRLQVEHPVTELASGVDLVALQLRLAMGLPLPFQQGDVQLTRHAIEFRINAEDVELDFHPTAGVLTAFDPPLGPGVRVDTHCHTGYVVPPFYDSLLAKVIVDGSTRDEALVRSRRSLREFVVEGVPTTIPFHRWLLEQDAFVSGDVNTSWTEQVWHRRAPA